VIIEISALVLLVAAIVVLAVDAVAILGDWTGRIHIGRYADRSGWDRNIRTTGLKWLNRTPKVKVTDNTRLVVLDMWKGNYSRTVLQHWQEAPLLLGLSEHMEREGDASAEKAIAQFLDSRFTADGNWKEPPQHVDSAILAYAVLKQKVRDPGMYRPAMDEIWRLIQDNIGEDGTVLYRKWTGGYRYVDTIGFICPFLAAYGIRYDNPDCISLAEKQIEEYVKYGMLEQELIPCHAYDVQNKRPLGLYGWGRGIAWFSLGLMDMWRELPEGSEGSKKLERIIILLARSLFPLQTPQGAWNWTAIRPETRADSSATAVLGWFMRNASVIEEISGDCSRSYGKAVAYLMSVTRRNGIVDFSQGDTKDIGAYSHLFNKLPFTQGFCIRLGSRI